MINWGGYLLLGLMFLFGMAIGMMIEHILNERKEASE